MSNRITEIGKLLLKKQKYLLPNETIEQFFERVARAFQEDEEHGNRIKSYLEKLWFLPSTPILATAGTDEGLPISCFLNNIADSMESIKNKYSEIFDLSRYGGGIATNYSSIRQIGSDIKSRGAKAGSILNWIKVQDSQSSAISQGGTFRHGSMAVMLNVSHPEILEFIAMRTPGKGDINRRSLNLHHGVIITDDFMEAIKVDGVFELVDPHTNETINIIKARDIWQQILITRLQTGEPYITFIDTINNNIPEEYIKNDVKVNMSNLCQEITLHTSPTETAVCCLSSLNLEYYDEWKPHIKQLIEDVMIFLSKVMETFILRAPNSLSEAVITAMKERSVGLGVMGFHSYLQQKNISMESLEAEKINEEIFSLIHQETRIHNRILGRRKGVCQYAKKAGTGNHFTHVTAIAPTATISTIAGETSEGIHPIASNAFNHKSIIGTTLRKNKYLDKLIQSKDLPYDIWKSIIANNGSIQHLDEFTHHEKDVFKTAYEIDQFTLVKLTAERQKYIDQSQSLNLFLYDDIEKKTLHDLHYYAWTSGIKTLYYLRSLSSHKTSTNCLGDVCNVCQ